jgi:hypothetical protein
MGFLFSTLCVGFEIQEIDRERGPDTGRADTEFTGVEDGNGQFRRAALGGSRAFSLARWKRPFQADLSDQPFAHVDLNRWPIEASSLYGQRVTPSGLHFFPTS